MMNRLNIITLGVKNMTESIQFYRDGLGFQTTETVDEAAIVFFQTPGTKLAIYPLEKLAEDINEQTPPSLTSEFSGMTLAYNAKSEAEVDDIIGLAKTIGATVVKRPQKVFWGGYSGYFTDPNGYYWEVAYNPFVTFDDNEMLV